MHTRRLPLFWDLTHRISPGQAPLVYDFSMSFIDRKVITRFFDRVVYTLGFLSFFVFILRIGFYLSDQWNAIVVQSIQVIVILFCLQELLRWFLAKGIITHIKDRWFENFIVAALLLYFIKGELIHSSIQRLHPNLGIDDITIAYLGLTQLALVLGELIRFFRSTSILSKYSLSAAQVFSISFAIPILIGTLLLKLPKATVNGISWLDALFTSTSALCVTGLTVLETATDFTPLGQFIICFLFQIGGLGIMTLSLAFGILFSGGLGLKERVLMSDIISEDRMGEIGGILAKITAFTFTIQAIGATLIYLSKGFEFQALNIKELYAAIFHAISAFCNAGFSLHQGGLAVEPYASNVFYGLTIMLLIVIGGIGFPVIINLYESLNPKKRGVHFIKIPTRLVLVTSAWLIFLGALFIFLLEGSSSFAGLDWKERLYQSTFLSITSRTAGFNIWATESLSMVTCLVVIALMWIGGSPMSTAGGIKNLTIAIAFLAVKATVQGRKHIEIYGRELTNHSVFKAFNIIIVSLSILFVATIALILLEPQAKAFDLFFEAVSAFSTVGLTRGVTANLSEPSKLIIIALMYTGRIGFITFLSGFFLQMKKNNYKLLKENIPIS